MVCFYASTVDFFMPSGGMQDGHAVIAHRVYGDASFHIEFGLAHGHHRDSTYANACKAEEYTMDYTMPECIM